VREDYEGPRAVGMRAVICLAHAADKVLGEVPTIESLRQVPDLL
jgi:hypothetical protein